MLEVKKIHIINRMIKVNIFNTINTKIYKRISCKKYLCVNRYLNPINMMGASKKIMEMFLIERTLIKNYQWLDLQMLHLGGSLLHGLKIGFKKTTFSAPNDVKIYSTPKSSELCLLSGLLGNVENFSQNLAKTSDKIF